MLVSLSQHEDDDEDDSHLCIKCNATIIGLDNYVQHRKNLCNKSKLPPTEPSVGTFPPDPECNEGADAFFQSLELQSSVKKTVPAVQNLPSTSKTGAGVLTRRATAAILAKDIYSTVSIVSNKRGEDWIGGHSLKVTDCEDNQTKLIKAVANISGSSKKESATPPYSLTDEESNDDIDELDDIEDDEHHQTGGKWKPISAQTSFKWKSYSGRDSATQWITVNAETLESDRMDDWEEDHFSIARIDKLHEVDEEEEDAYMPPPGHTKGKWIPGAKDGLKTDHKAHIMDTMAFHKEGGSVQYLCGPCNRRLGSKLIYDRHLSSKLHQKRTLAEKDLEYSGMMKTSRMDMENIKKNNISPDYLQERYGLTPKKRENETDENLENPKKRRKRCPMFIVCLVCKSKVKPYHLGKHLISHYHFRKGDQNDELNKILILDNIHKIIRQSPFQCSPCKFYTNWQAEFMRHWRTIEHRETMEECPGRYWCSFCQYECDEYSEINDHLVSDDHQEVVAVINRSIPIIIRKKSVISCNTCTKEFKYNVQLKRHFKSHCLMNVNSTASDEYQSRKKCPMCPFKCKSKVGVSRHMKHKHGKKLYFCTACSVQFSNPEEARHHRRLQEHRIKEKETRKEKGFFVKDLFKSCPHCKDGVTFKNIIELKKHVEESHKDTFSSCSICGMKFVLPQEATWHTRNKACSFNMANSLSEITSEHMWSCRYCPFMTSSHAECIYHETLHGEPVKEHDDKDKKHNECKYSCPVCNKVFPKHSLRCHLRRHTNEKPHACNSCDAKFFRKNNLIYHIQKIHEKREDLDVPQSPKEVEEKVNKIKETPKLFLCLDCGASFSKKFNLQQHMTTHAGRNFACQEEGCIYKARTRSELRLHAVVHSDMRPFKCNVCEYSAKTKMQLSKHSRLHSENSEKTIKCPLCSFTVSQKARLQRHLKLHTGQKPYGCRYCSFTCNSLENLRKHVLSRKIHKGLYLYECGFCPIPNKFVTNFAKLFRAHLSIKHSNLYPDYKSTEAYVSNYLKNDKNEEYSEQNSTETKTANGTTNLMQKTHSQTEVIFDELPIEGCYSVTKSGNLVPYLGE